MVADPVVVEERLTRRVGYRHGLFGRLVLIVEVSRRHVRLTGEHRVQVGGTTTFWRRAKAEDMPKVLVWAGRQALSGGAMSWKVMCIDARGVPCLEERRIYTAEYSTRCGCRDWLYILEAPLLRWGFEFGGPWYCSTCCGMLSRDSDGIRLFYASRFIKLNDPDLKEEPEQYHEMDPEFRKAIVRADRAHMKKLRHGMMYGVGRPDEVWRRMRDFLDRNPGLM